MANIIALFITDWANGRPVVPTMAVLANDPGSGWEVVGQTPTATTCIVKVHSSQAQIDALKANVNYLTVASGQQQYAAAFLKSHGHVAATVDALAWTTYDAMLESLAELHANPICDPTFKSGYVMTFSEEFGGAALDTTKWNTRYLWGYSSPTNNELEYYQAANVTVAGGICRLAAKDEDVWGTDYSGLPAKTFNYTSGMINTRGKFAQQYGLFECRCKVPSGKGLWPAFWMLTDGGFVHPPEYDGMEFIGDITDTIYQTYHWDDPTHAHETIPFTYEEVDTDFSAAFHTYAISWSADLLLFYVDGTERGRVNNPRPSKGPMYLIANLAVGGTWPGNPDESTTFPAYLDVAYVRAYQTVPA